MATLNDSTGRSDNYYGHLLPNANHQAVAGGGGQEVDSGWRQGGAGLASAGVQIQTFLSVDGAVRNL